MDLVQQSLWDDAQMIEIENGLLDGYRSSTANVVLPV
jgi:hypothetical protein